MTQLNKYTKLMTDIEKNIMRHETPTTFEAVGAHFVFKDLNEQVFKQLFDENNQSGLDHSDAHKIIRAMIRGDGETIIGPYYINHYLPMYAQVESLSKCMSKADIWSRQFVITFPALHCFQTIQILFRNDEVFVSANMRSCNFKKNFLVDLFLSYYCGKLLIWDLKDKLQCTFSRIHVIMNIGSLHIFKEEV